MESNANPSSMKAAVVTKFGDPSVITVKDEYPIPKITKPNEVLVRMYATSVTIGDCFVRSGKARLIGKIRPPYVAGIDGSGVVVGIGEKVTKLKVGDEVLGEIDFNKGGCAAQYCVWEEKELSLKPKNMDFTQAASLPVVGFTTVNGMTKKGDLKPGERVLIIGAAGGIGSFSVQYAKALGAYVIGVCSTNNVEYVKSLGADEVIDYKTQKFKDVLKKEEDKVDMVFDTVGDISCERQGFSVLKSKGRYIAAALSYSTIFRLLGSLLRIIQPYKVYMSKPSAEIMEKIVELAEQGKIKANEIKTFPLDSLAEAHQLVQQKRGKGKVVVVIP